VLVTGGAGFIGANLADRLASEGHDVLVYDTLRRPGVERNLAWLRRRHAARVSTLIADVRDQADIEAAVQEVQAVFHLAGQTAVTTSLDDPLDDFSNNLHGTVQVLDAVRRSGRRIPVLFASTNKVYGELADIALRLDHDAYCPEDAALRVSGIGEDRPLDLQTPYGCSKGSADQYVRDWHRSFGVPTVVFRMSCIYGPRQMGTEDQGWVAHFLLRALRGEKITLYGDGRQVRDILHVDDAASAYVAAWKRIDRVAGSVFNLGGGPGNAVSLRQVLAAIAELTGTQPRTEQLAWRIGDQRWYVSDTRRAADALGLRRPIAWREGLADLAEWLRTGLVDRDPMPARPSLQPEPLA
jgi:CDP-paratose 2-epimerase